MKKLKILLLSGGIGKRLWPLSNSVRSKQFLKLLKNEQGEYESMIQRVCRQLADAGLLSSAYIITCESQMDIIKNQIGSHIPVICEPSQRGTFPSIVLACAYLHSHQHSSINETICVLPVDSYVEPRFYEQLLTIPDILQKSQAELALFGALPQFPSEQFGYIVPKQALKEEVGCLLIDEFIEKPNSDKAQMLIEKNAYWNCGIFGFSLNFMIEYLKEKKFSTSYSQLLKTYDRLPDISFDYQVVEKNSKSIVIPYSGQWKDLGSWEALSGQLANSIFGKGSLSEDCQNTQIVNEMSIPIHAISVSDTIIAASPDGILVANKHKSNAIKEQAEKARPMYEEKRWGVYKVLDFTSTNEGMHSLSKLIKINPGKNISYQTHQFRQETWTVISGEGKFILDGRLSYIKAGDVLQIPFGAKHAVKAITSLEIIEVQWGEKLLEEDIIRIADSWDDTVNHSIKGRNRSFLSSSVQWASMIWKMVLKSMKTRLGMKKN
ncbi:sugar phosphate nucleotidyltransferase [Cytobacillus sp. SAFR-174]|uniref:sugar phosphate nucleotidyltransferase n=1 Tax=Cytobacillus sp. SAFR-174 TaxID=3436868 RepID=UPI003F7E18B6